MKLKHYGMALVPICLATFLFRAMELILAIDPKTGYFASGSFLPILFDGFLILIALFFGSVLFTKREPKPAIFRLYRAMVFDTIFGIAASVLLITTALYRLFSELATGVISFNHTVLFAPGLWQLILSLLVAVFLIFFVTYPKRSAKQNGWRIMSLSLTVYYLFLLVFHFQDLDVVFSRAFGIYLITFYGIAAACSINFSKILARLFGRKLFIFFTCLMGVLMSVRLADAVLFLIPGNPYTIPMDIFGFFADLCITVLMLSQMKKLMLKRRKKPVVEEPISEESISEEPILTEQTEQI